MKIAVRSFILVLVLSCLLCCTAGAVSVEQVQAVMPEIDVYIYADGTDLSGLTADDISATLGGEPLAIRALEPSEQGIYYVYMIDVSGSMPRAHFDAAKQAILSAHARLREQDRMAVITFGSEVKLILQGGESYEDVEAALGQIGPYDKNTRFNNAMRALVILASKTENMRRIAVVISDGIDDTEGGITLEELEQSLQQYGVSVSAMCIDTVDDTESFRHLVGMTGGELYSFGKNNAGEVFDSLLDRLAGGWLLALEAGSNMATGVETPLVIDISGETLELTVVPERYEFDTVPPRVTSAAYSEETHTVSVVFSEAMADIDDPSGYRVSCGTEESLGIDSIEVVSPSECVLHLAGQASESGEVTIQISGLHDASMEQNEMYTYKDLLWLRTSRVQPTAAPATPTPEREPPVNMKNVYLYAGGAAAVVVLVLAALLIAQAIKKSGKKTKGHKRTTRSRTGATFVFTKK